MEVITLLLFGAVLVASVIFNISVVAALAVGLVLFVAYALLNGYSFKAVIKMLWSGIYQARQIIIMLALIGIMTAMWRAAGTIPTIVSYCAGLLEPHFMLPVVFLLCCLMSLLTGTAFGTASTMGVITSSVALSMNLPPVMIGGAVLAGCYFGDRCSPVSTSMLLTAQLTGTDPYDNIRTMLKTAFVPFIVTCVIYVAMGLSVKSAGSEVGVRQLFSAEFRICAVALLPAIIMIVLAVIRLPVRIVMSVSIVCAVPIAYFVQGFSIPELLQAALNGFHAQSTELAPLIDGGGFMSMLKCVAIIIISSSYAGIFDKTPLLTSIQRHISGLADKTSPFAAVLITSLIAAMASCNQTLATMLTHNLCSGLKLEEKQFASYLENSVILVSPLIPWSIAGSVVLTSCGLPIAGISLACFNYLVPLWRLLRDRKSD